MSLPEGSSVDTVLEAAQREDPNYKWKTFAAVGLSTVTMVMSFSIVVLALSSIAEDFDITLRAVSWVVIAQSLTISSVMLPLGRVSDITGRKGFILTGLVLFGGGAVFASFSNVPCDAGRCDGDHRRWVCDGAIGRHSHRRLCVPCQRARQGSRFSDNRRGHRRRFGAGNRWPVATGLGLAGAVSFHGDTRVCRVSMGSLHPRRPQNRLFRDRGTATLRLAGRLRVGWGNGRPGPDHKQPVRLRLGLAVDHRGRCAGRNLVLRVCLVGTGKPISPWSI